MTSNSQSAASKGSARRTSGIGRNPPAYRIAATVA
jgi:hypothetical protein